MKNNVVLMPKGYPSEEEIERQYRKAAKEWAHSGLLSDPFAQGHRPGKWRRTVLWFITGWRFVVLLGLVAFGITWLMIR